MWWLRAHWMSQYLPVWLVVHSRGTQGWCQSTDEQVHVPTQLFVSSRGAHGLCQPTGEWGRFPVVLGQREDSKMAFTSTNVIMVECFKNGCFSSVCIPRGSTSWLLPLQKVLQDQQVGLTWAPFKLMPLCWDLQHVRFCGCPLSGVSILYSPLALLILGPTGFQSQVFWGLVFWCRIPRLRSLIQGSNPLLLGEDLYDGDIPLCGSPSRECGSWLYHAPILPTISLWFLF